MPRVVDEAALLVTELARTSSSTSAKESPPAGKAAAAALEESVVELIADLLHRTAARGEDPEDVLDRAQMHFEAEAA
ncbi:hypothetical protein [Streptomyces sp. NPDC003717]|uniref:hypothetical protein n=1 Tax=Streptomyces sp. NPDC003717 TaxID=3154276 RepID=UPI0033A74595